MSTLYVNNSEKIVTSNNCPSITDRQYTYGPGMDSSYLNINAINFKIDAPLGGLTLSMIAHNAFDTDNSRYADYKSNVDGQPEVKVTFIKSDGCTDFTDDDFPCSKTISIFIPEGTHNASISAFGTPIDPNKDFQFRGNVELLGGEEKCGDFGVLGYYYAGTEPL